MNNLFLIGKKEVAWTLLVIGFFALTLKLGVWYGSENTPLVLKTQVVKVETENIVLRDKVASLAVDATMQNQKIIALSERMLLIDNCLKRKWRGC